MTWLVVASAVVSFGCVAAGIRSLVWALCPTWLDVRLLSYALGASPAENAARLRDAIGSEARAGWERAVFDALAEPSAAARSARLGEELTEFERLVQRGSRVPRVCASIATSAGFLFASVGLIRDLSTFDRAPPPAAGAQAAPASDGLGAILFSALDALAIGAAGTSFCAAAHLRASRAARDRMGAAVRLVDRLESIEGGLFVAPRRFV